MLDRMFVIGCLVSAVFPAMAWAQQSQQDAVDSAFDKVGALAAQQGLSTVAEIDHARLAAAEGVAMPPSRVLILSDPQTNTAIISENIRAGLDLPFRFLSLDDSGQVAVIYTGADFLQVRHGLGDTDALRRFDAAVGAVAAGLNDVAVRSAPIEGMGPDGGIIELVSAHDFATTLDRLKTAVAAQTDTVWFGSVDFAADARALGTDLPQATVLLFGGPKPGGVAMAEFPAIGLDAFCQKLFVYEAADGRVIVLFNDIEALAKLHYGRSIPPHAMLNQRLGQTFAEAIK